MRSPRPVPARHEWGGVEADDAAVGLAVAVEHCLPDGVPAGGHGWPARAQRFMRTCMSVTTVPRRWPVAVSRRSA